MLWVTAPAFRGWLNLGNVLDQSAVLIVLAVGMTFVILGGGIDLSVGSVLTLSSIALGMAFRAGWPLPSAIAVGLATGAACGALNGLMVAWGQVPPFVATLGMLGMARGVAEYWTRGENISGFPPAFSRLADPVALGPLRVSPSFMIAGLAVAAAAWALARSRACRHLLAVGGSEEAARLSGVAVRRVKLGAYALSGLAAGLAGVLDAARFNSAQMTSGFGAELAAIAAVVVGGTSLAGGQGTVLGTLGGALLVRVVGQAIVLWNVDPHLEQAVIGALIVLAVSVDRWTRGFRSVRREIRG